MPIIVSLLQLIDLYINNAPLICLLGHENTEFLGSIYKSVCLWLALKVDYYNRAIAYITHHNWRINSMEHYIYPDEYGRSITPFCWHHSFGFENPMEHYREACKEEDRAC